MITILKKLNINRFLPLHAGRWSLKSFQLYKERILHGMHQREDQETPVHELRAAYKYQVKMMTVIR